MLIRLDYHTSRVYSKRVTSLFFVFDIVAAVAERARSLGVARVPAVVIDGRLADCCTGGGPDAQTLKDAGIGQPLA